MSTKKPGYSVTRRRMLAGLGGITLGLPWLEKLDGRVARAQSAASGPKRMIVVSYEMGVPTGVFRPSAAGTNFTLPYVSAPLEKFKDRCLFVTSVDNDVLSVVREYSYGHGAKAESALTGTLTTSAFPASNSNRLSEVLSSANNEVGGANGPSVDFIAGEFLYKNHTFKSVDLAVDGGAVRNAPADTRSSRFFFESAGNAISQRQVPRTALDALFAGVTGAAPEPAANDALRQLRLRKKSVLDAVRASFTELKQGLGRADRIRLEEHAARIRQVELDVAAPVSECSVPTNAGSGDYKGMAMDQLAALQIPILANAMACDLAPVGRLSFSNQQNPRFGIDSVDSLLEAGNDGGYDWHALVHGDPAPGTSAYMRPGRGPETQYDQRLQDGYRFFVQQYANLLSALDEIPEGPEGSVLDNSLVLLVSDLGEGLAHDNKKMAYTLAGNLGGAQTGFHLDAGPPNFQATDSWFYKASKFNVNQVLNSILDMVGVTDAQGKPVTMGLGGFLEDRGLPRRIDEMFI
jgi:hypothetical protein